MRRSERVLLLKTKRSLKRGKGGVENERSAGGKSERRRRLALMRKILTLLVRPIRILSEELQPR